MDYDEISDELGHFSKWHFLQSSLLWLFAATGAFGTLSYSFSGLEPDEFRCLIPECNETLANTGSGDVLKYSEKIFARDDDGNIDFCRRYPVKSDLLIPGLCTSQADFNLTSTTMVKCTPKEDIIYGTFGMDYTVVTRFNLVCDDQYKVALTGSIYMSSLLFASYVFGTLADKIGRKKTSFIALFMNGGGIFISSFMPEYISFTITRFITGFGAMGVFAIPFTLNVELVGLKYKTIVGLLFQVPFAIGEILIGLCAMYVRDYRWFQTALAIPHAVMLLLFFIIPESPRWLIQKKKYKEARKVIESAAKFNKVKISPHLLEISEDKESKAEEKTVDRIVELGIPDLFKHTGCRNATFIMFCVWIAVTLGYYGISMSTTGLSDDIYVAFILSALVELPAYFLVILLMDHWGRKPTLALVLFIGGAFCIPAGFTEGGLQTALVLIGKFGCSGAFCIIYMFTFEIYPTIVRTTGMGLCSMVARVGAIAAPQVAIYLPEVTFKELPLIIFGSTTFIAAVLSLWLPETLGSPLVESLDEIYLLHKYSKPLFSWWSKEQINQNIEKINALSTRRRPSRVSQSHSSEK